LTKEKHESKLGNFFRVLQKQSQQIENIGTGRFSICLMSDNLLCRIFEFPEKKTEEEGCSVIWEFSGNNILFPPATLLQGGYQLPGL